ncbi:putative triacylglycerol lipase [Helianthus anomalus]
MFSMLRLFVQELYPYKVSPPPFLSLFAHKRTFKSNLLRGANFASGGSGIFSATGQLTFNKVICMEEQIQQFATVRGNITELLGSPKVVDDLLQKSIYLISIGSNDLVEYALTHSPSDSKQFMANLTQAYAAHLTVRKNNILNLYNLGARKFAIIGIPPIGCCPTARVFNDTGGCAEVLNDGARLFYKSMQSLLTEFSFLFKGFKYSLGNTYAMTMNVIDNPRGNGFKEVIAACCGNGTTDCVVGVNLCPNRGDFLFWDKFHPTEKASKLAALTLVFGEGDEYVTPMNFSSLAMIGNL